jgi:hypothetical protein
VIDCAYIPAAFTGINNPGNGVFTPCTERLDQHNFAICRNCRSWNTVTRSQPSRRIGPSRINDFVPRRRFCHPPQARSPLASYEFAIHKFIPQQRNPRPLNGVRERALLEKGTAHEQARCALSHNETERLQHEQIQTIVAYNMAL